MRRALSFLAVALVVWFVWHHTAGVLPPVQQAVLFLFLLAVGLWITEAVPAFAVGLLIMGYLVFALGTPLIMSEPWNVDPYLDTWSSPVIWLMLGGFFMAEGLSRTGLDRLLAGGLPRGRLVEYVGRGSCGRFASLLAALLLERRHPAFATQLAVGEIDEKVRALLHGHVVVDREVLAELEGLEAVDDHFGRRRCLCHQLLVQQEAVPAEAGDVAVNGGGGHAQVPGDLPVGHASGDLGEDEGAQMGAFLPVGCAEGLGAEGAPAVQAGKPLDTLGGCLSLEVSRALEGPVG